jgi:predicted secreted Zn-dependent protease
VTTSSSTVTSQTTGEVTVVTVSRITRYALVGQTAEELDIYMRALGPLDSTGNRWFALTEPLFNWDPTCACNGSACRMSPVTVTVTVDYTLPTWEPPPAADANLVAQWNAFETAVVTHERGHGDLATTCGQWLGEAFVALELGASCDAVDSAISLASNPVFAECRAAQRDYENATNHGQNDGVLWPPY